MFQITRPHLNTTNIIETNITLAEHVAYDQQLLWQTITLTTHDNQGHLLVSMVTYDPYGLGLSI